MNEGPPAHPTPEELLAYPLGELTAQRARAVFNHCNRCEECGRQLALIMELRAEAVVAESLAAEAVSAESQPAGSRNWRWAAVAAGAVLVVATLATWGILELGDGRGVVSAYAELATHETLPAGYYDFRFGSATLTGSVEDTLREGLLALTQERYDEAIEALESYLVARPADGEGSAYLGVALYLSGDVSPRTVALLEAGTGAADSAVSRNASWYLGNVELAAGNLAAARARLQPLAADSGRVGRQARELLARIPQ